MRQTYRVLAGLVAVLVVVQAAAIVYAIAGLGYWIQEEGGVLDKAAMDSEVEFTGVVGFMIHGMNGTMLIPLVGLALLVVSFFAKVPHGIALAGGVAVLIALQIALGIFAHAMPWLGPFHGINAFLLLGTALMAVRAASALPEQPEALRQPAMSA
jgi:hypothetical protein